MKYFKDTDDALYVDPIEENYDPPLIELTEQEFNDQLLINNPVIPPLDDADQSQSTTNSGLTDPFMLALIKVIEADGHPDLISQITATVEADLDPANYNNGHTYAVGDLVTHIGKRWRALADVTQGQAPDEVYEPNGVSGGWIPV
jgi:hypothetical protein